MTNTNPTKTHAPKYNVEDITFGVEIESHIPRDSHVRVGSYYTGNAAPLEGFNGNNWQACSDCSIHNPTGRRGCEFVSPVLKGSAGLANLRDNLNIIKAPQGQTVNGRQGIAARVNSSCGIHVHIGVPTDLTDEQVARLVQMSAHVVGKVEGGIYAATGTDSRENGGYSRPIKGKVREERWNKKNCRNIRGSLSGNRFHGLNITNICGSGHSHRTIEFRYFSGSTNPDKVCAWVQMCVALVQLALTSPKLAKPDVRQAQSRTLVGKGQGEKELNRLFYTIGWTAGKCRYFGLGEFEGFSIKAAKKTLRRLARKYDGTEATYRRRRSA